MPFIDMGEEFANAKETPLAPESEQDLKIAKLAHDTDNGKNNLVIDIDIEGGEYRGFRTWVGLPNPAADRKRDEEKGRKPGETSKMKMLMAKRFCYLFNIPYDNNGFNTDDFLGATTRHLVVQQEIDGQSGKRLVNALGNLPMLPEELEAA